MPKIRALKPDFWTDETIVELTPLARLLFQGLWTHACDNGHVEDKPRQIKMRVLPADDVKIGDLLDELSTSERITRKDGWIVVPNFPKHQKVDKRFFTTCAMPGCARPGEISGTSQRETRRAPAENTSGSRRDHDDTHARPLGGVDGDSDGDSDGDTSRGLTPAEATRGDVERICKRLADRIEANGAKRPTITKGWRDAARLMLDRDERTESDILGAIDWCQADAFWRGNVLSLPKLREKYDQLRLHAQRPNGTRQDADAAMFDRQMARAIEQERQMGIQQ